MGLFQKSPLTNQQTILWCVQSLENLRIWGVWKCDIPSVFAFQVHNCLYAVTPLRWNPVQRQYAVTLELDARRYAATPKRMQYAVTPVRWNPFCADTPIRRNLVLRQNADTPKPRITPIRRNLVLRHAETCWNADTPKLGITLIRRSRADTAIHWNFLPPTLCIQSLFYLNHICWQLLSFLVSAWHAYPHLRALSHEHCCKLSCAFFPFTGIWQW